jgi:nitroreductase
MPFSVWMFFCRPSTYCCISSIDFPISMMEPDLKQLATLTAEWLKKENLTYFQRFLAGWEQGKDMILRSAPHLVVASASEENPWARGDCAIGLTYVELAAKANGLGTRWAGLFTRAVGANPAIHELLGVEQGHRVFGALMLGYPV